MIEHKIYGSEKIEKLLSTKELFFSDEPLTVSFINPYSYFIIRNRKDLVDKINLYFVDGSLLVLLNNLFFINKIDRISFDFSSIAGRVFSLANDKGMNVVLVGGSEVELSDCVNYLEERYSQINYKYSRNGFFSSESEMIEYLSGLPRDLDLLICGMGTPLQEDFIILASKYTKAKVLFTCGGFISQTGSKGDFYHPFIKKTGLRWLQRAIESKHVRKRLLYDYPIFLMKYLYIRLNEFFSRYFF
ncbi:WecB/TagA/CpsF family glycosyltransferase [Aliivibrio fischeri]|uniref:WecB/TagA/CpsF family glycosyltransferase n=1 Tax=Aliivibrio fischeri TaxID=668 RepID=UPI0012DA5172|nr:WecB/TagA/CpsF family glycosyltransferase [Aliivibrio fischeri]MUL16627.1 hypothetical protein [Aliivibrio fischeri]